MHVKYAEDHFVKFRHHKKILSLKVAYEDIRIAPINTTDHKLLSDEFDGIVESAENTQEVAPDQSKLVLAGYSVEYPVQTSVTGGRSGYEAIFLMKLIDNSLAILHDNFYHNIDLKQN